MPNNERLFILVSHIIVFQSSGRPDLTSDFPCSIHHLYTLFLSTRQDIVNNFNNFLIALVGQVQRVNKQRSIKILAKGFVTVAERDSKTLALRDQGICELTSIWFNGPLQLR